MFLLLARCFFFRDVLESNPPSRIRTALSESDDGIISVKVSGKRLALATASNFLRNLNALCWKIKLLGLVTQSKFQSMLMLEI